MKANGKCEWLVKNIPKVRAKRKHLLWSREFNDAAQHDLLEWYKKVIKFEISQLEMSLTHFEVVKDVADERDVAHPLLQRARPHLLTILELLLEPVQ